MKRLFALLAFLAISPLAAQENYESGRLTIQAVKEMPVEQRTTLVTAVREAMVFTLHGLNVHWMDECVAGMTNEEVQAVVDTVLEAPPEIAATASFVGSVVQFTGQVCISVQQELEQQQGTPVPQNNQPRLQII